MEALNFPAAKQTDEAQRIQEVAIVIAAKKLSPTLVSEDFLKFGSIVPHDWEVNKQPVLAPNFSQISFDNGISVIAQPGAITFLQTIIANDQRLAIPEIARRYVQKLPGAEYQTCEINPKILVPFLNQPSAAGTYITETLLAPGPWQKISEGSLPTGIDLTYQLARCQFKLSVNSARLQSQKSTITALLFSGSFNYIINNDPQERLLHLEKLIENGSNDWNTFRDMIDQKFLWGGEADKSIIPNPLFTQ
ncbi:MAG: hypothetical protein ACFB4I_11945 [Cyanophyceae cyanobacterium]